MMVFRYGSHTYGRKVINLLRIQVDLRHKDETKDLPVVEIGIDLTEFYQSVEWDILSVPAQRLEIN